MAARSLNKVFLIGNLTRDPEFRYTPNGTAVCSFGVATNRQWVTETGEKREDVEFHRIVAWQKLADICAKFLSKGRKVFLEGRLQTRTWTGKDGQERQITEIIATDMIILDSRRDFEERRETAQEEAAVAASPLSTTTPTSDDTGKTEAEEEEAKEEETASEKSSPEEEEKNSSGKKTKEEKVEPEDIPF